MVKTYGIQIRGRITGGEWQTVTRYFRVSWSKDEEFFPRLKAAIRDQLVIWDEVDTWEFV